MRHLTILAALASAVAGLTTSPTTSSTNVCLTEVLCSWLDEAATPGLQTAALHAYIKRDLIGNYKLTNAQRLARGLPLKPPVRRSHHAAIARRHHPLPSTSSTPKVKHRGIIQINDTASNGVIGYVSKNSINLAQLRYETNRDDALILSFELPVGQTFGDQLDLTAEESDIPSYQFFGLVQGRDNTNSDLAPGSFHYGYMTLTNKTPVLSTPQTVGNAYTTVTSSPRTSESAVWSWSQADNKLTPQWINADGTEPITYTFTQATALYVSGDPEAFKTRSPAPITKIALIWVPI